MLDFENIGNKFVEIVNSPSWGELQKKNIMIVMTYMF